MVYRKIRYRSLACVILYLSDILYLIFFSHSAKMSRAISKCAKDLYIDNNLNNIWWKCYI